ncbi:MAG: glycoside hydrolase family 3 C-terminal domain-containing protein [Chthoniobacterales bacterium]
MRLLPSSLALLFATTTVLAQKAPLYMDASAAVEERVNDLFDKLSQAEKLSLLSGTDFTTQPIAKLGLPALAMVDAGQGVRGGTKETQGPATAFPSGVVMASTWNPELISQLGRAIGDEARNKGPGSQVLLGPAVNIHRSPLGGRNGEYFSEDPYLAARLAVDYIKGVQGTGVAACVKHYACNNEEADRMDVDVNVSERALREIYLPAFEAAVKEGGVWCVMSAYNKINGPHASANAYLLTDVLKKGWDFDGLVMSDWGGVHQPDVAAMGNDLEMPGPGEVTPQKLTDALKRGTITQAAIDDSVRRILRTAVRTGSLDKPPPKLDPAIVNSKSHQKLAFDVAAEGLVLLKNQGNLLPLDRSQVKSIAVIGNAAQQMQIGAAGSPTVQPFYTVELLDGIRQQAGTAITVHYAHGTNGGVPISAEVATQPGDAGTQGFKAEYFPNTMLEGAPVLTRIEDQIQVNTTISPAPGVPAENFSVRWSARITPTVSGTYEISFTGDDGFRVMFDHKTVIDNWSGEPSTKKTLLKLQRNRGYDLVVELFQKTGKTIAMLDWTRLEQLDYQDAIEAARKSNVAIVCVSTQGTEGEGHDRPNMDLPNEQEALILAVAKANKRTIVVLNNGTPVSMKSWIREVPAVLEAWFPGQEGGAAIAAILFGDVNPSGKLPDTFAVNREDYPDTGNFPGTDNRVKYAEDIYVGYRHFDKKNIAPLFPFGHGLSYTTFSYGPLKLSQPTLAPDGTVTASIPITNTGTRAGAEVVQLYLEDPKPVTDRPVRELKGFSKVALKPRETKVVSFTIKPRDLAWFDTAGAQWRADAGIYGIEVGASSRDIRQKIPIKLTANFTEKVAGSKDQMAEIKSNLAAGKPVKASSFENSTSYKPADVAPENAVDNNPDSRWSSEFSDPQWIAVDFGAPTVFDRVRMNWQNAHAASYAIEVSNDGNNWTAIYKTDKGPGGIDEITFPAVKARWVRMFGIKRATEYGYSLFDFAVFGPAKKSPAPPPVR